MCCTYLHRCSGLAGVIDANFPIFAHCGQQLSIRAPRHAKDLHLTHKRKQKKEEKRAQRPVKWTGNIITSVCASKHIQILVTHLFLVSSEDFDLISALQVPQSDCEIVG